MNDPLAKIRLGILISGRGSNLQALINACLNSDFPAQIAAVISNVPDARGLERARQAGIPALVIDHKAFANKPAFEHAIHAALTEHGVDLVCLAGFMRIISPWLIEQWPERIINIHPSLLPAYKGLDTHRRALENGETQTGCTVHYVTPDMDSGPIILQRSVSIIAGDTPETLAERVLEQEHIAYPEAVRLVAETLQKAGTDR